MSKPKKTEIDLSKPYEENDIKLRGTVIFCSVTFAMIVFSFVFIYYMNRWVLASYEDHNRRTAHPMAMDKVQQLPPEPRLQSAPGFGVGEGDNRVNLELSHPAAEYIEVQRRWNEAETKGKKDPATGAVVTMPVADGKAKFLESNAKQRPAEEAMKSMVDAQSYYTGSSSGRSTITRR